MHWVLLAKERSALSPARYADCVPRLLQHEACTLGDTAAGTCCYVAKVVSSIRGVARSKSALPGNALLAMYKS